MTIRVLVHCSYFLKRFNSSLPQNIFSVLTYLGSYAPQSFLSTRTHAQHLHRLAAFCLDIIDHPYLEAIQQSGGSLNTGSVEGDCREKMRVAVLLKTILCTHASDVMVFLPMWKDLVARVQRMMAILYEVELLLPRDA